MFIIAYLDTVRTASEVANAQADSAQLELDQDARDRAVSAGVTASRVR